MISFKEIIGASLISSISKRQRLQLRQIVAADEACRHEWYIQQDELVGDTLGSSKGDLPKNGKQLSGRIPLFPKKWPTRKTDNFSP